MERVLTDEEVQRARKLAWSQWQYLLWKVGSLVVILLLGSAYGFGVRPPIYAQALLFLILGPLLLAIPAFWYGYSRWREEFESDLSAREVRISEIVPYDVLRARGTLIGRGFHMLWGYQDEFMVDKSILPEARAGTRYQIDYLPRSRLVISARKVA